MKKVLFTALSIMAIMICAPANAQNTKTTPETTKETDDDRKPIKSDNLPQGIKDVLDGSNYDGWDTNETAYWVKATDTRVEHYEVTVKNTTTGETKMIRFDPSGKIIA